jgi:hypothetical protein
VTARELTAGTTRASQHPPGYTGTLPLYDKGPMAEQGLGAAADGLGVAALGRAELAVEQQP